MFCSVSRIFLPIKTTALVIAVSMLSMLSFLAFAQQDPVPSPNINTTQASGLKQKADYQHVLFEYFQQDYARALTLIEVGDSAHQFTLLEQDDHDRLRLMQGAAQLNMGLNSQAQSLLLGLLSRTSSDYVQANTWYWLAKAGFDNRQYDLSERAFAAIEQDELEDEITEQQWQELIYLNAFTRMQQSQDWQVMYKRLEPDQIYPAYVQANLATIQFNQGQFADAEETFIRAKQDLLNYRRIRDSWLTGAKTVSQNVLSFEWLSFDWISFAWLNPMTWFSNDPNASAQGNLEKLAQANQEQEENALFDRINLGLSYALLQQQDQGSALEVINTISEQGGESDQALLTLGWTLAQQNRWQQSLDVWRYLQSRAKGIYGLQASYGIAYAHQQQGQFADAFFALDTTSEQISQSITELDIFVEQVQKDDFFDSFSEQKQDQSQGEQIWPMSLLDIKRVFLSTRPDFDAKYLLSVREQSQYTLQQLVQKTEQLEMLMQMLENREQSFAARQQNLSLTDAQTQLEEAQAQLAQIKTLLNDNYDSEGVTPLTLKIATPEQVSLMSRLENASARHERLLKDDTRRRPVSPKYAERLARVRGALQWQLENDFIANRWQHLRLMQQAQASIDIATSAYEQLKARQKDSQIFARQQAQIDQLNVRIAQHKEQASVVYIQANGQLQQYLLEIIEQRKTQLNAQQVNTRLAMLRLQDLQPEAN